jgi:hypothetical protein
VAETHGCITPVMGFGQRLLEPPCRITTQQPHVARIAIAVQAEEHDQGVQIDETRGRQRPVDDRTVPTTIRTDAPERRHDGARVGVMDDGDGVTLAGFAEAVSPRPVRGSGLQERRNRDLGRDSADLPAPTPLLRRRVQGGQIAVEPVDIPTVGRSAVLMDPQVAELGVLPPAAQQWEVSGVRGFDEAPGECLRNLLRFAAIGFDTWSLRLALAYGAAQRP